MKSAARLLALLALCLTLLAAASEQRAAAFEESKLVQPGRLVIAGRSLTCGATSTLVRDFEGFAVSSTVIMLNMTAMKELPRMVQWLIYYHECGHILFGQSETAADQRARDADRAVETSVCCHLFLLMCSGRSGCGRTLVSLAVLCALRVLRAPASSAPCSSRC